MYRKFREDPSSVDPSWHEFLVDYSPESTAGASNDGGDARSSVPSAPREPGPAPAPKAAAGNGAPAKAEQAKPKKIQITAGEAKQAIGAGAKNGAKA